MDRQPKKGKAKAKRSPARKSPKNDGAKVLDLEKRLAETLRREAEASKRAAAALGILATRDRELAEALEQQTATSEILRVISRSQTNVQPVFGAILTSAVHLLEAFSGSLSMIVGDQLQLVALTSTDDAGDAAMRAAFPQLLPNEFPNGRAIRSRAPISITEVETDASSESLRAIARARGYHSIAAVPLLRSSEAIGAIGVSRRQPGGFAVEELALLQTFADQAVIAIENVRLFTELQEKHKALTQAHAQMSGALEQQTATAEILSVISGSPTDIQPVFDAVLDRALTLCEASHGSLYQLEDGALRHVAARGTFVVGFAVGGVLPLKSAGGRAVVEKRTVHLEDVQQELDWQAPEVQVGVRGTGIRTMVAVPLLREQKAIGAIIIRRLEVRLFSEKQIRLLQRFADQAVIAVRTCGCSRNWRRATAS